MRAEKARFNAEVRYREQAMPRNVVGSLKFDQDDLKQHMNIIMSDELLPSNRYLAKRKKGKGNNEENKVSGWHQASEETFSEFEDLAGSKHASKNRFNTVRTPEQHDSKRTSNADLDVVNSQSNR